MTWGECMKKIGFSKLYELDYDLSELFAVQQFWKEGTTFRMINPRRTSCLLYFCGCSATYKLTNNRLVHVARGSILYIPEGSVYETKFFDCDGTLPSTILIEFSLNMPNREHFCLCEELCILIQECNPHITEQFNEAVDICSSAVISISKMKSVIYDLLTYFSHTKRQQNIDAKGFKTIAKGIAHLENELKSEISVSELAKMCHVSESTFRRLFRQYTGKSPVEYRIEKRMVYAKMLLRTESMTVAEVAAETGFDDPAYFCRVFKKHAGVTAGEYLKGL